MLTLEAANPGQFAHAHTRVSTGDSTFKTHHSLSFEKWCCFCFRSFCGCPTRVCALL